MELDILERKQKSDGNLILLQHNNGILLPSFFASYRTPNDGQCKLNICVSNVFLCSIG